MREHIRRWIEQARAEIGAAEHSQSAGDYFVVALLCHQAVEKALKALFIVRYGQAPPKTHNLVRLGIELRLPDRFRGFIADLAPVYVASRYPDATGEIPAGLFTEKETADMLDRTLEVVVWIEQRLGE